MCAKTRLLATNNNSIGSPVCYTRCYERDVDIDYLLVKQTLNQPRIRIMYEFLPILCLEQYVNVVSLDQYTPAIP